MSRLDVLLSTTTLATCTVYHDAIMITGDTRTTSPDSDHSLEVVLYGMFDACTW